MYECKETHGNTPFCYRLGPFAGGNVARIDGKLTAEL